MPSQSTSGLPGHTSADPSHTRRLACWHLLTAAVTAGCPVPKSIYLRSSGTALTLIFATRAELDAAVAHFGAGPVEVLEFPHSTEPETWLSTAGSTLSTPSGTHVFLEHYASFPAPDAADATSPQDPARGPK